MRIKDIQIERFGVWQDLALPLNEHGVTVFYGPNEAGKSTLMRFVRGTLYGFNPQGRRITRHGLSTEGKGTLRITHNGQEHQIARAAEAGQRGNVRVDQLNWGSPSESQVATFLHQTSESMFENIFAIGLQELQELATLDGEEVAEHIYGLSLGPDGECVLKAHVAFERERALLISDDYKSGEAVELAQRIAEIDGRLADLGSASHKHRHLQAERSRLTAEIDQAEAARRDLQDNLRGFRFLERIHGPWSRARHLRQAQAEFADSRSCPVDALQQHDALTREIDGKKRQRAQLRQEAKRLHREAREKSGDPALLQQECTIRRLADERSSIRNKEQQLAETQSQADKLKRQCQTTTAKLGQSSTVERPAHMARLSRLLAAARTYQQAQTARKRTLGRYKKLVATAQKRQTEFNEYLRSLDQPSPDGAIRTVHTQLEQIDAINRLCLKEARLAGQQQVPDRSHSAARQPRKLINYRDLPPMFNLVMLFFTMAGLTLFVLGLWGAATGSVAAGNTAWIVGGIYACFGLCMAGVTWTVRQHFEQFFEGGLTGDATFSFTGHVNPETRHVPDVDLELTRVRSSIRDLVQRSGLPGLQQALAAGGELIDANLIGQISNRLAELQRLREQEKRIQADRQRLSHFRDLQRSRQREVGLQRRRWCEVLREHGLAETLNVETALEQWQAINEADVLRGKHAVLLKEIAIDREAIDAHYGEIRRLQEVFREARPDTHPSGTDPDRLITRWLGSLGRLQGSTDEQAGLRRAAREKRKAAAALEASLRDLMSQHRTLMRQAGASTREELEQCAQSESRHRELTERIEEAQLEMQLTAAEEPELAVVEEDLLSFHPSENKRRITDGELELNQIDRDLQTAREELGRLKQELTDLAGDRSTLSLRFEREQAAGDLRQVVERWATLELAMNSLDQIRYRMERHGQSETLQLASRYLSQLTVGRYPNIWSPLGERHLCIDDDNGQSLKADQLSTGTREQLFLAIRLAMIRRMADEGTELPLVLDDVFVNFDQTRTEAAVETILDVAEAGQQVLLFTCHLHLADIFESQGVEAVWLPTNGASVPERKAG